MNGERLTKEILKMAAEADSVEALSSALAKAKAEATPEEIKALFDYVHKELSDESLSKITGGKNDSDTSIACGY